MPFFFLYILQKIFFCFLPYNHQRQMNSFRISGVHGILSSQIIPLQYTTLVTGCQVEFVLIIFYYFSQHSITIFAQHLTTIFLHVLYPHYNRKKLLTKMQFRRSKSLSYKTFCGHFPCAFLHANHKLTQLYHTIHLTICQVKIALIISMYFLQNTAIKHFTHHLFSQTFLCVPFTSCLFKKITHHPPRAACLLHEHICLSRTSFYILCEYAE